jgi:3-oxoadipate CoA-transferase alpha subunit
MAVTGRGDSAPRNRSKVVDSAEEAISRIDDGAVIMVAGFGGAGFPFALRDALIVRHPHDVTIVCNNSDFGGLAYEGGLSRLVCSYPTGATSAPVIEGIEAGRIKLDLTPQGTLVERLRAGGSGLGGVLTPTGLGTEFEVGYAKVEVEGKTYLLVPPLRADVALLHAHVADVLGNLVLRHAARNFTPLMAMAASHTIVEADAVVAAGEIDPDHVHVPSAFVDAIVPLS